MFFAWLLYALGRVLFAILAATAMLFVAGIAVALLMLGFVVQVAGFVAREVGDEWRRARARRNDSFVT